MASGRLLTRRALNRATLARQLLLERAVISPLEAVHHLAGLQAQTTTTWYTGLWGRLAGFDPEELSAPLAERTLARISLMRGTIHLVTADDALAFRPVVQVVHDRMLQGSFGKRLVDVDIEAVATAGRALVDAEPMTFSALGARLHETWPDHDPFAMSMVVRGKVALVQVPPRGLWRRSGQARHTSAEAWLGRPLGGSTDPDAMVLRYLAAFGPATVMDIQAWCGLTRLAEVIDRHRAALVSFVDERGRELFDLPDAPRPSPEVEAPVRLLYDYDNLFLSHADRSRVIPDDLHLDLPAKPGPHYGMVLVDGMISGWWQHVTHREASTLVIHPSSKLAKGVSAAVTTEAEALARFLDPAEPEVVIVS